ncbi:Ig-like domain repeat protein [Nocardioides sp.]|uniref:Ig-like domain repeat protein n=1 Tax=Nocardioides sp. TaxID=35761 RepID=UPI002606F6EE|nr:Ig-like domain repeat protein [Nocardioides sp.]
MHLRTWLAVTAASAMACGVAIATPATAHAETPADPVKAGTVLAWGADSAASSTTIPPDLGSTVVDAAANSASTAVVTADGTFSIWGDPTGFVQMNAPTNVTDATAVAFDAGGYAGILLHRDGTLTTWGGFFDLSTGKPDHVKAFSLCNGAAFAVTTAGKLVTWGYAQAASVTTLPQSIKDLSDIVDVAVTGNGGIVLRRDGSVMGWGNSATYTAPPIPAGTKVTQIAGGYFSLGAVLADGTVQVWGESSAPPAKTFPGKTVESLALAGDAAVVLKDTATGATSVAVWGSEGSPYAADLSNQAKLDELANQPITSIAIGETHAVAVITGFRTATEATVTGTPVVGSTLTANPATFSIAPDAPATGQWFATRDGVTTPIEGQTATTMTVTDDLIGATVSYRTTATRGSDTVTSTSEPTAAVTAPVASTVRLAVSPAGGAYGTRRTVTATVATATGPATGSVAFATGALHATVALTGGKATWTLPATLAVGTHQLTASYTGTTGTKPSSARATVTVAKASSTLLTSWKAKGKTRKVVAKVTLTITVRSGAAVSKAGTVKILIKGKKTKRATATVNAAGVATVTVKNLKRGTYTISVDYAGNGTIAGSHATRRARF